MTNFDKKIRLYFIEMGYIPAATKAEFIYLSKLLSNDMQQQDSPIPMQDDSKKRPPSNAIELHDKGLENVFKAILKQDANKLKAQLNKIELEYFNTNTEQDNE